MPFRRTEQQYEGPLQLLRNLVFPIYEYRCARIRLYGSQAKQAFDWSLLAQQVDKVSASKSRHKKLQLGSRLPSIFLGVPSSKNLERKRLRQWFSTNGWDTAQSRPVCSMLLTDLTSWSVLEYLVSSLKSAKIELNLVYGLDHAESTHDLINTSSRQGILENLPARFG